jgi:hypothetical protein
VVFRATKTLMRSLCAMIAVPVAHAAPAKNFERAPARETLAAVPHQPAVRVVMPLYVNFDTYAGRTAGHRPSRPAARLGARDVHLVFENIALAVRRARPSGCFTLSGCSRSPMQHPSTYGT